jgi:hypothetical protein
MRAVDAPVALWPLTGVRPSAASRPELPDMTDERMTPGEEGGVSFRATPALAAA